jgi:integrase
MSVPSLGSPAGWPQRTRLRSHLLSYVVPFHLAEADQSTVTELLTTVKYWEEATGDMPIQMYRNGIPLFQKWLLETKDRRGKIRSAATRRKHLKQLQFMLDLAGPASRERDAAGIIELPPKIASPKGSASITKRPIDLAEIGRLLTACQSAFWQKNKLSLPACAWWRCLLLFLYNTGLRIETTMLLRWEWLEQDGDEHWWLAIPAHAMKRDEPFQCFVSPAALAALQPLRAINSPLIFAFPWGVNQARRKFLQLLKEAAVPLRGLEQNKFHALRRSCWIELQKISFVAGKLQLGHSTRDVSINHYSGVAALVDAHARLPQPMWSGDFFGRQLRLFE